MTAIQALVIPLVLPPAPAYAERAPDEPWKAFVSVAGQPEPVPAQWVATPEGRLAHSIVIPNPVPKDSGYRWWMSSKKYFEHLCKTEAGEFIFKTVKDVEGFYFARPPRRPTDDDLMGRYTLEAPEIERTFQLRRATPQDRARIFVNPPWSRFRFIEEPSLNSGGGREAFVRMHGYRQNESPMQAVDVQNRNSGFGLIWRGIRRVRDRENAIAGSEWIVFDLNSKEVIALQRDFGLSGFSQGAPGGIWWLNAASCPNIGSGGNLSGRFYKFVVKALQPTNGKHQ